MLASEVMNRSVITVSPDTTLAEAVTRMLDSRISGLPVVDASGKLVGILTEGDLLRRAEVGTAQERSGWLAVLLGPARLAADYVHTHARRVGDIMTTEVASVTEDTPLEKVVEIMEKRHVKRVPVVRGDALVGIISRADILRALARSFTDAAPPKPESDEAIRDAVCAELQHQRWANAHNITVSVKDGVVTLEGVIFNEALRPALRVAAENVPGVKRVVDHVVWVEPVTHMALGG
jgi:CBS domain-containing protein